MSHPNDAPRVVPLQPTHAPACEAIARALPDWFGLEDGLRQLRADAERGPGWVAVVAGDVVAFLTLRRHFAETWEITWLAVAPARRRRGLGRRLIDTAAGQCRAAGARLLLVETLADTVPSPAYAETRAFYRSVGFVPLVVLPEVWGPENPCLLLVRAL
ncbi:MAG TPA: GNAT family N-acetyltransferase [Thermomicrobiales bacterium]